MGIATNSTGTHNVTSVEACIIDPAVLGMGRSRVVSDEFNFVDGGNIGRAHGVDRCSTIAGLHHDVYLNGLNFFHKNNAFTATTLRGDTQTVRGALRAAPETNLPAATRRVPALVNKGS